MGSDGEGWIYECQKTQAINNDLIERRDNRRSKQVAPINPSYAGFIVLQPRTAEPL